MADTVYKLTHTGEQIDSAIDNAVRSDAQILTSEQQTQARTNIGAASAASAASAADLTTETNERITADTGVRGLTATVEATSTASKAYAIGAYFVYNGLLYKCTVAIAQGGTITPGTNCTATTAGAEITALNQNLAKVTHIPVNLPMNLPPVTAASVNVSFGTTYAKPPIVSIGSLIVVDGGAYPITQHIVGITTSGVTIMFGNFHQSATYQVNITGYIEVVES
jgi:hypothetical protein